jgi:SHS2 domain-containing protein
MHEYKFGDLWEDFSIVRAFWVLMNDFEVFEHTADVGIRAKGKDKNSAFERAAAGMFSIITDLDKVSNVGEFQIECEANDLEQLLVDWLTELLYINTAEQIMLSDFRVDINGEEGKWKLMASAFGEEYDSAKHPYHTEIKAVTHHILKIEKKELWNVQVLFDI